MNSAPIHAVLTGDLIDSTAADRAAVDLAMSALQAVESELWLRDLRFTRYRGDGWQMLLPEPGRALRLALRLVAGLAASGAGLSTRICIGFGSVTHAGTTDLRDASGTAFLRSGRGLESLPRGQTWGIAGGGGLPDWVAALIPLAAWQSSGWTKGQAEVVAQWLDPVTRTQEDWADLAGLSRQAWKSRFDGSGIAAWSQALTAFETWNGAGITDD